MANDNKQPERPTFDEVVNKVAEINYHHNLILIISLYLKLHNSPSKEQFF